MSELLENFKILINTYFYKTSEKPVKYEEWIGSEYRNGIWYISEDILDCFKIVNNHLYVDKLNYNYKLENGHLYVENNIGIFKIEDNHLYYKKE